MIEGEEEFGYERDLSHNPAVHAHGEGHERRQAGPIAFRKFAELAWEEVSKRAPAE